MKNLKLFEDFITEDASSAKIQKKVDEVNMLISLAIDKDGDPIEVIDNNGTWQAPMEFKPFKYSNGVLYSEYKERTGRGKGFDIVKDKTLKANMELDGYPWLLDVARWYRTALKKNGIKF